MYQNKRRSTHISLASFCGTYSNSAYPDQAPNDAVSGLDLHCYPTECSIKKLTECSIKIEEEEKEENQPPIPI